MWGSYAIVLVVLPLVLLMVPKFINLIEWQLFFVAFYVTTFEYLVWILFHLDMLPFRKILFSICFNILVHELSVCGQYMNLRISLALMLRNVSIESMQAWRAWYFFSRDDDIIEIELEQKAMFCVLFNQLCIQHSVCMRPLPPPPLPQLDMCSKLPATFAHFHVLSLRVHPRTIEVFLPPSLYL